MDCTTIGQVPPFGATGTGLLAKLQIYPGLVSQTTPLDLTGTFFLDTPPDLELSLIPVTLLPTDVVFLGCADVNGDGIVDLLSDILGVIQRYQWTPENHPDDWDWVYDLNDDGLVDLLNDILGTILQYQLPCWQPT